MTLNRTIAICSLLVANWCLGCHSRIDEVYNLPKTFHYYEEIYLGQSIRYLEHEGLIQYDEYCDCYSRRPTNHKDWPVIHVNQHTKSNKVRSVVLEYGHWMSYLLNEHKAYELIETLIREYGEQYIIVDFPTESSTGLQRPSLFWHTDEGMVVSISFMPHNLWQELNEEQVFAWSQVFLEFSISDDIDAKAITESTQWTRESLGLN